MASSHGGSSHSDAARTEQIITEFFAKSLHMILESRSPSAASRNYSGEQTVSSPSSSTSSSSSVRPRDKWFNLALGDCPAALENIDFWRQSNLESMVVDVVLLHAPPAGSPSSGSPRLFRYPSSKDRSPRYSTSEREEFRWNSRNELVIERWTVQYESRKSKESSPGGRRSSALQMLYKKTILLLRSLYLTVRLLPAYKLFRELGSSSQIHTFTLVPRVLSFVEPFTRREESEMSQFTFSPVDASCGKLCISVMYKHSFSDVNLEPPSPMTPHVIPDYVGSPIAGPFKRIPSLRTSGVVAHGSPNSLFGRPHSWSHNLYKAIPNSPVHLVSHPSISNSSPRHAFHGNLPPYPSEGSTSCGKESNFYDYWTSSPYSPQNVGSQPVHILGNRGPRSVLRSESAPVRIPKALVSSPLLKQSLPPSPHIKASTLTSFKSDKDAFQNQSNLTGEKLLLTGKNDSGKFLGLKNPCNISPRVSLSRSSGRLSFQDDDPEFECPFVDDDLTDTGSRPESMDNRGGGHLQEMMESFPLTESRLGALVRMLNKAAPLCQDVTTSSPSHHPPSSYSSTSRLSASKTTLDALEELRGYQEMKDFLLCKSGR